MPVSQEMKVESQLFLKGHVCDNKGHTKVFKGMKIRDRCVCGGKLASTHWQILGDFPETV